MNLPLWMRYPWLNNGRISVHQRFSYQHGHPVSAYKSMADAGEAINPMGYAKEEGLDWWGHPSFVQSQLDRYGRSGSRGDCDTTAMWLCAQAGKMGFVTRIGCVYWIGNDIRQHAHAVAIWSDAGERYWQSNLSECAPIKGHWVTMMRGNWNSGGNLIKAVSWGVSLDNKDTIHLSDPMTETSELQ